MPRAPRHTLSPTKVGAFAAITRRLAELSRRELADLRDNLITALNDSASQ